MFQKQNEKGFTLFEVIVSTMLFGIIITLVWNIFFTNYNNYKRITHHNNVLEEMRSLTDFVNDNVKRAEQVKIEIGEKYKILKSDEIFIEIKETNDIGNIIMEFKGLTADDKQSEVIAINPMIDDETNKRLYEVVFLEKPADQVVSDKDLEEGIRISNPLNGVACYKAKDSDEILLTFIKDNPYDEGKPHEYTTTLNLKYKW